MEGALNTTKFMFLVFTLGMALCLGPTHSLQAKEEPERERGCVLEDSPNRYPFLNSADVPGYKMEYSTNEPSSGQMVSERWLKYTANGQETGGCIKIGVFPVKSKNEAFALAEQLYYAITDKDQGRAVGRPTPGSLTGTRIGNFCWTYTVGFVKRTSPRKSATIVVVQGSYLFRLQVVGGDETINDAFVDGLGRKVAERLKTWPRPTGFEQKEKDNRDDD